MPKPEKVAAAYVDHGIEKIVFITKDMIVNQIKRDSDRIAASFDALADRDIQEVSALFGEIYGILSPQLVGRDLTDKSTRPTCARLLFSASTTFIACIELARRGYRRQFMMLSRSVVETVATVLHLIVDPTAIGTFHEGKLASTKSITRAEKVLPVFGQLYGMLSNSFVHIGTGHAGFEPLSEYQPGEPPLKVILTNMRAMDWLLYVAAELLFVDKVPEPRYWHVLEERAEGVAIKYEPSEREREWMGAFLRAKDDEQLTGIEEVP